MTRICSSGVQLELQVPSPYSVLFPLKATLQPPMSLRRSGASQEELSTEVLFLCSLFLGTYERACSSMQMGMCVSVHICVQKPEVNLSYHSSCTETKSLPLVRNLLTQLVQLVRPRHSSVSMVSESQVHNVTPAFAMWVLVIDLIFSCLHGKHFTY